MSHALLSPSSAHRWLTCTPSARLEDKYPDRGSEAAREGTLAHALAELELTRELIFEGRMDPPFYQGTLAEIQKNPLYAPAMGEHIKDYVDFVAERYHACQDPVIFLEHKIDLSEYVPEGYGTGDVVLIDHGTLELIDLKYGKGVLVGAEGNKQLKLYGLGALRDFEFLYEIHTVRLTIYQPRIGNFSSWDISATELLAWAQNELKPKAKMAWEGQGELQAGEHCRFCKAAAVCRANAEQHQKLARHDFAPAPELSPAEIAEILRGADALKNWIKTVEDYALAEALNNGAEWPGFKLVEGRSTRKYQDESYVAARLIESGYTPEDIFNRSVKGITEMEKLLGKKTFQEILGAMVIKPQGKPTLAPTEDKRPAWHSADEAARDFTND
jgi:hypothetical protein